MIRGGWIEINNKVYNKMRNRNLLYRKLEALDSTLMNLHRIVNTQEPVETYRTGLNKAQEIMEDIKGIIEREPFSANEQNPIR